MAQNWYIIFPHQSLTRTSQMDHPTTKGLENAILLHAYKVKSCKYLMNSIDDTMAAEEGVEHYNRTVLTWIDLLYELVNFTISVGVT